MIRSLAYFPSQCARNSGPVISAMLESAAKSGIITVADSRDCDAALIWSMLWRGRMARNKEIYEWYRLHDRPVIIAEVGCLHRGRTWKIAINDITGLGHYGHQQDLDPSRPSRLGLALRNDRLSDRILIAAQHSGSHQVQAISDFTDWIVERIAELRQYTDRSITVRPHPRDDLDVFRLPQQILISRPKPIPGTYDDHDFSVDYHAVVNYNSGPGILAALGGSRPLVHDSSLASPVSINISDIEKPYVADRRQWLVEISHTEYTVQEIKQGIWLKRLADWLQ